MKSGQSFQSFRKNSQAPTRSRLTFFFPGFLLNNSLQPQLQLHVTFFLTHFYLHYFVPLLNHFLPLKFHLLLTTFFKYSNATFSQLSLHLFLFQLPYHFVNTFIIVLISLCFVLKSCDTCLNSQCLVHSFFSLTENIKP